MILLDHGARAVPLYDTLVKLFRVWIDSPSACRQPEDEPLLDALVTWDCQDDLDIISPELEHRFRAIFGEYLADADDVVSVLQMSPPNTSTPSDDSKPDIPTLPGHYRKASWYFFRCWLGMGAGIGVFGLGLHWESVAVQIAGGVVAFASFLWMFGTLDRAQSAKCPTCSAMMNQGWSEKRGQSDGIFVCPQCKGRWRTKAKWGIE